MLIIHKLHFTSYYRLAPKADQRKSGRITSHRTGSLITGLEKPFMTCVDSCKERNC